MKSTTNTPSSLVVLVLMILTCLVSCSYNPFIAKSTQSTGSASGVVIGTTVGVAAAALIGMPKEVLILAGVGGGALGYYATTWDAAESNLIRSCAQVYQIGDTIGIVIPVRKLFIPNTAELLPQAESVLASAASILKHYPHNHILISGNSSGIGQAWWEARLSKARAKQVAAYFWDEGIDQHRSTQKLMYVGYGDAFPIANNLTSDGLCKNNRIQIISYADRSCYRCARPRIRSFKDEI